MIWRRDLLRAFLTSPLASWLRPWGLDAVEAVRPPDASAHYREAIGWLAKLTDSDDVLIRTWKSVPLDDAVDEFLRRASPALSALRRGARTPACEWPEVARVESLGQGHLDVGKLRLARIALLRARRLVEAGRGREALDDAFAAAGFGRHLGHAGLLISRIYQLSLENESIAALAASLPKLDRSALDSIPARVVALPTCCSWAKTMRLEARFIASTVSTRIKAARSPVGVKTLERSGLDKAEAESVLSQTGGDRERLLALIEGVVPILPKLAEILDGPRDRLGPALETFKRGVGGLNPFANSAVDHAEGLKYGVDRTAVLWEMLLAARTLIAGGPGPFRSIADPFGDGPFLLLPEAEGFLLRSALHSEGKPPAILRFGGGPAGAASI